MGPPLVNMVIMSEVIATLMALVEVILWKLSIAKDRGSLFK
jgi:hypothetical protein